MARDHDDAFTSGDTMLVDATRSAVDVAEILGELALRPEDRFRAEGLLATGGMGAIEIVVDRALRRRLARKVIHEGLQLDDDAIRRFVREARVTGRLDHPNIVPIHEVGLDPEGRLYFTMKLVTGDTLETRCAQLGERPVPPDALLDLLDVVVRVCDALSFAHDRGVLHCDVKPANVMVGAFGQVYLMDWGIARVLGDDVGEPATDEEAAQVLEDEAQDPAHSSKTRNAILGSPAFMAPEQAWGRRQELTPATDVYAVGALLYFIVTGHPPHAGETFMEALYNAQESEPAPVPEHVPRELVRIIGVALAREPEQRYASADAVKQDLVRFLRGGGEFPTRRYAEGEPVVTVGDLGDAAYLIVEGSCDAVREVDGERVVLRTMGPGEVFGETAILSEGPRTATVVAREDSVLQVVDRATVERELGTMKPWMGAILRGLAERFRDLEQRR